MLREMTIWDFFAGCALIGLLSRENRPSLEWCASEAWDAADAMVVRRNSGRGGSGKGT